MRANVLEPELIYSRTDRSGECWLWLGNYDRDGYGELKIAGRSWRAHRASYTIFRGEIPQGLQIDHLCRVRACVDPEHLEPVTGAENLARAPAVLSTINQAKTHCIRGHEFTAENTYVCRGNRGRRCRECDRSREAHRIRRLSAGWRSAEPTREIA